ncbi:MAG: hypothetical protein EBY16_09585 [Gammaproteobacteria bacterium]|nr:hypothetical protein [Gammaproteobacteria bacterium]
MKFLKRQIIQNSEVTQAITREALDYDLIRTAILGENKESRVLERDTQQPSRSRQQFEEFWMQLIDCESTLKYQQGLTSGSYLLNHIGMYATYISDFNPANATEEQIKGYQSIKQDFKQKYIAYKRNDGTWGGLGIVSHAPTNEWALCITQIQFQDRIMDGTITIVGRGKLFDYIQGIESQRVDPGQPLNVRREVPAEDLVEILDHSDLARKLVGFVDSYDKQNPQSTSGKFRQFCQSIRNPNPTKLETTSTIDQIFESLRSSSPASGEEVDSASENTSGPRGP